MPVTLITITINEYCIDVCNNCYNNDNSVHIAWIHAINVIILQKKKKKKKKTFSTHCTDAISVTIVKSQRCCMVSDNNRYNREHSIHIARRQYLLQKITFNTQCMSADNNCYNIEHSIPFARMKTKRFQY